MQEHPIAPENGAVPDTGKTNPGRRKIPIWIFAVDLLLIAAGIALLVFSGFWRTFTIADMQNGIEAAQDKLISFSVNVNYGYFAERYDIKTNTANGRYLISSLGDEPVVILIPNSMFDTADRMQTETSYRLLGLDLGSETPISGEGYVRQMSEEELDRAYTWFAGNGEIFSLFAGAELDLSDASNLIGTHVIIMDYNGTLPKNVSSRFSSLAFAVLALALILPVVYLLTSSKPSVKEEQKMELPISVSPSEEIEES